MCVNLAWLSTIQTHWPKYLKSLTMQNRAVSKIAKHINEPGCAVLEAVNSGVLDYKVYASYLKLRREAWHFSASEHEKRKKEKSFTKLVEEVKNRKANR